jgi:hypothetical protein
LGRLHIVSIFALDVGEYVSDTRPYCGTDAGGIGERAGEEHLHLLFSLEDLFPRPIFSIYVQQHIPLNYYR